MSNTINFSYLRLNTGLLSGKTVDTTIKTNYKTFLQGLVEKIKEETYCVPFEIQEIRQGNNISLKSLSNGLKSLVVKYHGYGDNIISVGIEYGVLKVVYNGLVVICQYCNTINKKDRQTIIEAFKVLKYAKTIKDIRDSKMFAVLA